MRKKLLSIALMLTLIGPLMAAIGHSQPAEAAVTGWDPAYIISDSNMYTQGGMSTSQIQSFLNSKGKNCYGSRCIKNYRGTMASFPRGVCQGSVKGGTMSAAEMIYRVSSACKISAKVLLVTLEKENSLISSPAWYNSSTGANAFQTAMGYGCPDGAPCAREYYGVGNQIYHAAKQFNLYKNRPKSFNFAAGRRSWIGYNPSSSCGGSYVTIKNAATAGLYNYTPYQPNSAALQAGWGAGNWCSSYGNRNFYGLYKAWFGNPRSGSSNTAYMQPVGQSEPLKYGAKGTAVLTLQQGLLKVMPNEPRFYTDGVFGAKTKSIVLAFQKKNGLKQDGIVDFETSQALINAGVPLAVFKPLWRTQKLSYGESGDAVKNLQMGFATVAGTGYQGKVYGNFRDITKSTLLEYQSQQNLSRTGSVDMATSAKLVSQGIPLYVVEKVSHNKPFYLWESGPAVTALQLFGKYHYPQWYSGRVDGTYGNATKGLVSKLQQNKGLAVTGMLDAQTAKAYANEGLSVTMKQWAQPEPMVLSQIMRRGDSGAEVKNLQAIMLNYFPKQVDFTPDGGFGPKTEAAVKAIQRLGGIYPDGMVGIKTANYLRSKGAEIWFMKSVNHPTAISWGQWNDAVWTLQVGMKKVWPQLVDFTPDGGFGAKTETSVKALQGQLGMAQTGIVDAALADQLRANGIPLKVASAPDLTREVSAQPLGNGVWNDAVWNLQKAAAYYYPDTVNYNPDGGFGKLTENTVRKLQHRLALPVTGKVDSATSQALNRLGFNIAVIPSATISSDLAWGDWGDAVYTLQWAGLHFYPDEFSFTPDGSFGAKSKAIVQAFQRDAGLQQTGIVDRATAQAMQNQGIPLNYR